MRYLKLFESFEDIDQICKQYNITDYTINSDGSIDVNDSVDLNDLGLKKLPLKFNKVNGFFDCSHNNLTSLEGSPIEVNGCFDCGNNKLTTLEGSPKKVGGFFDCSENNLTTLEGCPKEVNGDFYCSDNNLTSFEFAPIIRGDLHCSDNNIKSFEYFPGYFKGYFYCYVNPIEEVWCLFQDTTKIELLNDFDIFRDEDTDEPKIFIDRLNDFLEMIGYSTVEKVDKYKNI